MLSILNAHSGDVIDTESAGHTSLDAFKSWLASVSKVAVLDQVLLLPSGKQARLQSLINESEVFLFNRSLISGGSVSTSDVSFARSVTASLIPPSSPPSSLADHDDIRAYQRLFDARREWANQVAIRSQTLAGDAQDRSDALTTIQRGLAVAVGNLKAHIRSLESKHAEATQWVRQADVDQKDIVRSTHVAVRQLPALVAYLDFLIFLPGLGVDAATVARTESPRKLSTFVSRDGPDDAVDIISHSQKAMTDKLDVAREAVSRVCRERDDLIAAVENSATHSELNSGEQAVLLLEEIQVLADKVASDSNHISAAFQSQKAIAQASKMSTKQAKDYLPNLRDYFDEMVEITQRVEQERSTAAVQSLQHMQMIAQVEKSYAQATSQLETLHFTAEDEQAFEYLNLVAQLPFIQGALLIESVRRHEWSAKLKAESAILAEDIAGYREEEEKRRSRWQKSIGPFVKPGDGLAGALDFELSLQADELDHWPRVTREEIQEYLLALGKIDETEMIVEELTEAFKDLDKPTKRQIRRAKGFKNGSVHEAASGKGSFLLRENEEIRLLRELNSKIENDLDNQKSRVRKLENVLIQQTQRMRPNSGNPFSANDGFRIASSESNPPEPQSPAGRPKESLSRTASTNSHSRRTSTNVPAEDTVMVQRIVTLEAELHQERKRREVEYLSRTQESHRAQNEISDIQSTKRDLMENMEAQQREFADERRILQEEVKEHKLKIEDMEDELDRNDQERQASGEKIRSLEMALEVANTRISQLQREKDGRGELESEQIQALHGIRSGLDAQGQPPQTTAGLLQELEELVERSSRHVKDLTHALEAAKSDNGLLQANLDLHEKEADSKKDQIRALEEELSTLQSDYAAEVAKAGSFSTELEDARTQLRILRSKFAEGETGSESLRNRLEEQAVRASSLASELAQCKSHVNSLDFELSSLQRRNQTSERETEASAKRLEQRNIKDRDLTSRLVTVNDELAHLLEALGLSVIRRDGVIAIQRTSKIASASTSALVDPVEAAQITTVDLKTDRHLEQWMQAESLEEESNQFSALMKSLSLLDLNLFSEAIIKLRRDVEWTGKKWKSEARNNRDKYHRVYSEAHSKIAYRGFKEGDLALFLPTRNQATRPFAAFNVGAPHYFLREQDSHKLQTREWLVARITKVEERVVDLSKTMSSTGGVKGKDKDTASFKSAASEGALSYEDDNPFELSDGLRWFLLDATEEKSGAPSTPGLGRTTVASANVDARASLPRMPPSKANDLSKQLNKSLDSRRSSSSSKRASFSANPDDQQSIARNVSGTYLRPGSRSSFASPTGLGIQTGSPSQHRREYSEEIPSFYNHSKPKPIPQPFASSSATTNKTQLDGSSSPSKPAFLDLFGGSISPPKINTSWFGRTGDRTLRPSKLHEETGVSDESPPKSPPRRAADLAPQPALPTNEPSPAKSTRSVRSVRPSDAHAGSTATSPRKEALGSQSQKSKTAWESLWSIDIGVEEGKSKTKK